MFLSKVEINTYRRKSIKSMDSPQVMHAAVMSSFCSSSEKGRVLWRTDRIGDSTFLLIQSGCRPDLHHIVDQYGYPESGCSWETVDYSQHLNGISEGQEWRFRLTANPVHSVFLFPDAPRGKVVAYTTAEEQIGWLLGRSEKLGFNIVNGELGADVSVVQKRTMKFMRQQKLVTINVATFEGTLRVEDSDLLRDSMEKGIGRAKAYGCGLMTICN